MRAAGDDTPTLPEDPAPLRALLLETRALVDTLVAERDALTAQNERLQHLLPKLKRRQFGRKAERLPEEQLLFAFEEIEATLVMVTKRPKLACRSCAGVVVQRPAPARLVEGELPTEATVAHVMVSRYADHLPLL